MREKMPYTPKYKPGDVINLKGEIAAIVNFTSKDGTLQPMYLIKNSGSWYWAWAETVDTKGDTPPGGDPLPPPIPPN
jgi:hypothetical protein